MKLTRRGKTHLEGERHTTNPDCDANHSTKFQCGDLAHRQEALRILQIKTSEGIKQKKGRSITKTKNTCDACDVCC